MVYYTAVNMMEKNETGQETEGTGHGQRAVMRRQKNYRGSYN